MRCWTVGLAILAAGCSGAGGAARWEGTVTDSAGIQVVHNPVTGMWTQDDQWTVTEVQRIGTAEGEPEYQFGQLQPGAGIAVASDGRIVVLDAQAQHLKVFTPDGRYERTIGGPGGGPGEIGAGVTAVLVAPGDTLLVSDIGNQRADLFLMDGTFVRSFSLKFTDGLPFRWESAPDGRIIVQMRRLNLPGSTQPPDTMDLLVERKLDGTLGDTLMRVPSGGTMNFAGPSPEITVFSPEPSWALLGNDSVLYGVSDQYRIGVYGSGGVLRRVVEKPFELAPVTEADQQAYKEFMRKMVAGRAPPEAMAQFLSMLKFAPSYPAFQQMMGGIDGTIWVQQIQALSQLPPEAREDFNPMTDLASPRWDVFDREGRYLGVVTMPARFQPVTFAGDKIYGIQRDELDVQYIVVLRVVRGDETT